MKKGFTLAEVILTLTIIGVVAAITIPAMIHVTNKKATIEQLKKSAKTLNYAVYLGIITDGDVQSWNWQSSDGPLKIMQEIITPRLNVGFMCSGDAGNNKICSYNVTNTLAKDENNQESDIKDIFDAKTRVYLTDGSLIAFADRLSDNSGGGSSSGGGSGNDTDDTPKISYCRAGGDPKTLCGIFMIDVNGPKKPNVVGKDVFYYGLYLSGAVLPYGANESQDFVNENCTKGSTGTTCAAKIVNGGWDVCYNCSEPYPLVF